MEQFENPKNPKEKRNSISYESIVLKWDYICKVFTANMDDVNTILHEELSIIVGRIALKFSAIFIWFFLQKRPAPYQWPFHILKSLVGIFILLALVAPLLLILLVIGSFAAFLGLRNLAPYSAREQIAVYFLPISFLIVAPWIMSEYSLFRMTLVIVYALGVMGLDFLVGQCGIVSLASGGFLLTGAYVMTWLYRGMFFGIEVPLYLALIVAALFNGFLGILFGIPALRIKDHYLVIVSIAFTMSIPQLLKSPYLVKFSGHREGGLFLQELKVPDMFAFLPSHIWKYFVVILPAFILLYIGYNIFHRSQIARAFRSIRCDTQISTILGVPVIHYKLLAFAVSGVYAAFCGGFLVIITKFISPDSFGTSTSIDFLVANVIGGSGGVLGNFCGGIFLAFEPDFTRFVANLVPRGKDVARAAYGIILILVVLFASKGISGELASKIKSKFRKRIRRGSFLLSPPPDFEYLEEKKKYFPPK